MHGKTDAGVRCYPPRIVKYPCQTGLIHDEQLRGMLQICILSNRIRQSVSTHFVVFAMTSPDIFRTYKHRVARADCLLKITSSGWVLLLLDCCTCLRLTNTSSSESAPPLVWRVDFTSCCAFRLAEELTLHQRHESGHRLQLQRGRPCLHSGAIMR